MDHSRTTIHRLYKKKKAMNWEMFRSNSHDSVTSLKIGVDDIKRALAIKSCMD